MINKEIVFAMRSITHAMKARRILDAKGIPARVVKPEIRQPSRGCGYGIAIPAHFESETSDVLRQNKIPYTVVY